MLELPQGCVRVQEPEPNQHCCMELKCENSTAGKNADDWSPFLEC